MPMLEEKQKHESHVDATCEVNCSRSVHSIRPLVVFSALQFRKPLKTSLAGSKDESDEFSK